MSRFDGLFDAAKDSNKNTLTPDTQTSKHLDVPLPKSKDPEFQRTTIYLPRELHRRFKSVAALQGKDMSDVVSQLVSDWLTQESS